MKKLLVAILATSCVMAFAETTVVTTTKTTTTKMAFSSDKMKCKDTELHNGDKGDVIKRECKVQPKHKGDSKQTVRFIDDNSGKKVKCDFDKDGNLVLAQCMSFN